MIAGFEATTEGELLIESAPLLDRPANSAVWKPRKGGPRFNAMAGLLQACLELSGLAASGP